MIAREKAGGCRPYRETVFCVLLAIAVPADGLVGMVRADQPLHATAVGYQSGTITAIHQQTIQIDGRVFSLTPDAVLLDDSGNQLDAGALVVTAEVKYHVKKEQIDKIDRMIVILPR